jgi:hypothetical protein
VENKKLNIDPMDTKEFPVPEIPVDKAWAEMNQMLDADMPANERNDKSNKGRKRYLLLLLLLFIGGATYFEWSNLYINKQTAANQSSENKLTSSKQPDNKTTDQSSIKENTETENQNNNTNRTTADKNNSSTPLGSITDDKEAVANTKEKQENTIAASSLVAASRKNTGSLMQHNSGLANTTAALVKSKIQVIDKRTAGTGNNQTGTLPTNLNLQMQKTKAAVSSNNTSLVNNDKNKEGDKQSSDNTPKINDVNNAKETVTTTNTTDPLTPSADKTNEGDNKSSTNNQVNNSASITKQQGADLTVKKANQQLNQNKAEEKKTSKAVKQLGINYGLQWNVAIPLQGFKNYFSGTTGSSQPYAILLPDLWISKQMGGKQELLLSMHLSNIYATGDKQIASFKGAMSINDTTTVTQRVAVLKTSGFTAGLQYNFHLNNKWSIGAGIDYHLINRALIKVTTTGYYTGSVMSDVTDVAKKGGASWLYFNNSFLTSKFELSYYWGRIRSGAALYVPVSDMSSVSGNSIRPVNGQLFLRWRLNK